MKLQRNVRTVLFVMTISMLACGSTYTRYYPRTEMPRMMYIGNEVDSLAYVADEPESEEIYVEIRTTRGELERGNLLAITPLEVILSSGYQLSKKDDMNIRVENQQVVRKDNIAIMKVW